MTDKKIESSFLTDQTFTEAIHTIVPEIKKLARHRQFHPYYELECIFLCKKENGKVSNKLSNDRFQSLLNNLLEWNKQSKKLATPLDANDKKNWQITEDRFYFKGKIRETSRKNEKNTFESIWIQKDFIERRILWIPQVPYGFSISLKREKPLLSVLIEKQNFTSKDISTIRKKRRFSVWWLAKPFRTDFTHVYTAASKQDFDLESPESIESFSIETEFVTEDADLEKCKVSREIFQRDYEMDSLQISEQDVKQKEERITAELLQFALFVLLSDPNNLILTKKMGISLNVYPESLYEG